MINERRFDKKYYFCDLACSITTPSSYLIQYFHGKITVPAQEKDATIFLLI